MTCFRCGSDHVVKNGKSSTGDQKFRCQSCGRTFQIAADKYIGFDENKTKLSESSKYSKMNSENIKNTNNNRSVKTIAKGNKKKFVVTFLLLLTILMAICEFAIGGIASGIVLLLSAAVISPITNHISVIKLNGVKLGILKSIVFVILFIAGCMLAPSVSNTKKESEQNQITTTFSTTTSITTTTTATLSTTTTTETTTKTETTTTATTITTTEVTTIVITEAATEVQQENDDRNSMIVYVTKTGEKYHYSNQCNGATYYPSTLGEALARGLEPCGKCVN